MSKTIEFKARAEEEVLVLKAELDKEREYRTRLQSLDNMPDGMIYRTERDLNTGKIRFNYVSGTCEKLLGVPEEEVLADIQNFYTHIEPEDFEKMMQRINSLLDSLEKFDFEVRYRHPVTKAEHWLQISSYHRCEEDTVYSDGFIFDITARKQTELKLIIEKERLEKLGNNLPDGVLYQFVLDTLSNQMRISFVSDRWEEITGISAETAMNNMDIFFAMIHPDDLPAVMQEIDRSAETMTNFYAEFRITVHGKTRWIQMSSHTSRRDISVFWDGIILDITHHKEAERELELERNRLQMLGNNIPGGTLCQFLLNTKTNQMSMSYVSATWEAVTGISADATIGSISNVFNMIHHDDLPAVMQSLENSACTMTDHIMEVRLNNRWVSIVARPRRDGLFIVWDGIMTNITDRKETERELKAANSSLQILGDNIPGGTLSQLVRDTRTRQMRISYASATWEAVTGIPADVVMADITKLFAIIPPDEFPVFLQTLDESARNMTDINLEIHFGDRWMHIVSRPLSEGSLIIWNGIITDITERKKNEAELAKYREKLEQSHQAMRAVLDNLDVHIVVSDFQDYKILFANKKAKELFGDVDGKTCWKSLQKGMTAPCEFCPKKHLLDECNRPTGIYKWEQKNLINNEWYACRDAALEWIDGRMVHMEYATNITEQKNNEFELTKYREDLEQIVKMRTEDLNTALQEIQATNEELYATNEELYATNDELNVTNLQLGNEMSARMEAMKQLEESENKIMSFFTQSFEGVIITDSDGLVIEWNQQQERITGILRENALGKYYWDLCKNLISENNADDTVDQFRDLLPVIIASAEKGEKNTNELELEICLPGTSSKVVLVTAFPMKHGDQFYMGQIVHDITHQKLIDKELDYRAKLEKMVEQRTKELMLAKEKAEESDKLKSAFLANMSHEIRTPLNGIVGFLRFIDSDNLSPERRREYINIVNNSSMQLVKIIDDIIDVSKIEANQMNIQPVPVNLNEMMNELWVFFETYLQSKNKEHVELILDDSGFIDNCMVYVDATRLRQILTNLIGNAVKFTEKGYIRFGYRKSASDLLEFVVEDSGIGLRDDQQKIIFERFRQAETNDHVRHGGTGLGLTISRSLVEMKGGRMWVESSEGKGASFYFTISYLPVSSKDIKIFAETPDDNLSVGKPFAGKSVLFVEPVAMKFKYYDKLISATGASIIHAKNLKKWNEILQTDIYFDVVIADASLLDHESLDDISHIINARPDLPVALIVSDRKREKYQRLVRSKLCKAVVEVPVVYTDILKLLGKYAR